MIKTPNRMKTILTVEAAVNYWVFIKEKMVCYIFIFMASFELQIFMRVLILLSSNQKWGTQK